MKILELFGGIGACTKAFKRLGIPIEVVDYVEIDKYAVASYNAINGTSFEPQDITKWDKDIDVDFIMHGSPCQDFSVAGKGKGGDEGSGTRSSLMYETIRIVNKLKPKYVLWENVKNLLSDTHIHNFRKYVYIMQEGGYNTYYKVLNSKDFEIPQNRERVFTLSIRQDVDNGIFQFPKPIELKLKLKDMLESEVDEKYFLSESILNYFYKNEQEQAKKGNGFRFVVTEGDTIGKSITTRAGSRMDDNFIKVNYNKRANKTINENADDIKENSFIDCYNNKIINDGTTTTITARINDSNHFIATNNEKALNDLRIRKLTPKECWRLMGFDDSDFDKAEKVNSNAQLYKQAGNSIVVNVLEKILENLFLKTENDFEGQMSFEMLGGIK